MTWYSMNFRSSGLPLQVDAHAWMQKPETQKHIKQQHAEEERRQEGTQAATTR